MNIVTARPMRSWMIALALSFLYSLSLMACDFRPEVKSVYSLSGPVSLAFRDLGLLKSTKLKGVSVFHPIEKEKFSGTYLPGGVFLSHDTVKSLAGSLIFYDESRELGRILKRYPSIKSIEIKTRSLNPLEVILLMEKELASYVWACDLNSMSSRMVTRLSELKKIIPKKKTIFFFLGPIQSGRLPELLMVQDGVVKWMLDQKLITTYPSPLAYVNWSSKILNTFQKDILKVGIVDSGSRMQKERKISQAGINLTFPGSLIPGFGQVEAMIYLFSL